MASEGVRREGQQAGLHILDEGRADDRCRAHQPDEPVAHRIVGCERLAQQVLDVQDLDPALAHAGDELIVLPLGALDPQDIVEQELVMVGRGQPLEA
jgi:hypothetical protein